MLLDKRKSKSELSATDELEPPPYSMESAPSSRSRSRAPSILPPLPAEAYESQGTETRPPLAAHSSAFTQINLDTRSDDITGTFYVDPQKPVSELTNKKSKKKKKQMPDAMFRTRSAKIAIDLATTGRVRDVPKASVILVSKSGNITLNLLPADNETRPRLDLDITNNSGNVVIFLPRTYGGAIDLRTKHGSIEFLPAISEHINVVKAGATESLVLFGKQVPPSSQLPSDFCQIRTRSGRIIVGLKGEDTYVEELNFWQRIGEYFKGDHEDHPSPH
ncbi:hypothetical protein DFH08DRAFT_880422 [Mycena albidolilacea]|uniref:DUF7330 domain-containing protein n=1 Tax=Mycena albidolilacea TaxID=1033008 RepID=A0AAD6ZQG6_9AGAR|nr:hypothetical protein DFH08DRAFT_880422 [Mycena albidolilacea]